MILYIDFWSTNSHLFTFTFLFAGFWVCISFPNVE